LPKVVSIPPPLNTADIPAGGAKIKVTDVRLVKDQWTSIGTCAFGLGLTVEYNGVTYGQMFSLDRPTLTGSIGRILMSVGIDEVNTNDPLEKFKPLVDKEFVVAKKGGKLYWYVP